MVSLDKVVIDLPYDCVPNQHFSKKMFLNYFPSAADMMKCYKGQPQSATENLFDNFPHHLTRSQMSTKSVIGTGCEAIKSGQK